MAAVAAIVANRGLDKAAGGVRTGRTPEISRRLLQAEFKREREVIRSGHRIVDLGVSRRQCSPGQDPVDGRRACVRVRWNSPAPTEQPEGILDLYPGNERLSGSARDVEVEVACK